MRISDWSADVGSSDLLLSVRKIAVPGAIVQITAATLMGMGLAWVLDWSMLAGFFFGLSLSVASTVVLLRALQAHNLIETERGRLATGWLIVKDLVMFLAPVLLHAFRHLAHYGSGSTLAPPWTVLLTATTVAGLHAFP